VKPCVVVPVYDNPRTIEAVARGALAECPDVIVVDDGSAPATREAIARVEGVLVLRHERNLGKGAALRTGFAEALRRGFTHAITIDADGQHLCADIPRFLEAAARSPDALIVGERDLAAAGAGRGSRWGRVNSNFWTWVETGVRLPDTQSGFRCYPLRSVGALHLASTGYDLEIEVLVKASWTGVPLTSIPIGVRYFQGAERVSHLRPFVDFVRIGRLNTRLVTLRICLPPLFLRWICLAAGRDLPWRARWREGLGLLFQDENARPPWVAASVGLGLFMGIAPFWGFQFALTLLVAHALGLSKPIAAIASNVSFPLMIPPITFASLVLGRLLLGEPGRETSVTALSVGPADLQAWIAGSLILALLVATAGSLLTYLVLRIGSREEAGVGAEPPPT